MKYKCHFCEHDFGPSMHKPQKCIECRDYSNFQVKKRMHLRQLYEYEKLKKEEEWANDRSMNFDRDTALMILNDLSSRLHPSADIFGNKTLTINRYEFELIRKKYLDGGKRNNDI